MLPLVVKSKTEITAEKLMKIIDHYRALRASHVVKELRT